MSCTARLSHGPGHQSSTPCDVEGEHDVHHCIYGSHSQEATWRTGEYTDKLRAQGIDFSPKSYPEDMGMTGFFDEPPEAEE